MQVLFHTTVHPHGIRPISAFAIVFFLAETNPVADEGPMFPTLNVRDEWVDVRTK